MPKRRILITAGIITILVVLGTILTLSKLGKLGKYKPTAKLPDIAVPTIVNGELLIPTGTDLNLNVTSPGGLSKNAFGPQLFVVSANLIGIYSQNNNASQSEQVISEGSEAAQLVQQPQVTLSGIRILGEMRNGGSKIIGSFTPVVRFIDKDGAILGQKIGENSANFDFFGLDPADIQLYDITVSDPPANSDRVEVVLKGEENSNFSKVMLKIASRSAQPKTVQTQSGQPATVHTVSGRVVNSLPVSVSDISIIAWVKDQDGKVYGLGRQDFKSDLIGPNEEIPFKIMVLPAKLDSEFDSFEVRAWGKEYRL